MKQLLAVCIRNHRACGHQSNVQTNFVIGLMCVGGLRFVSSLVLCCFIVFVYSKWDTKVLLDRTSKDVRIYVERACWIVGLFMALICD